MFARFDCALNHAFADDRQRARGGSDNDIVLGKPLGQIVQCKCRAAKTLTNKFLHVPTHALHHADPDDRNEMIALVNRLYQFHRKNEQ